ncbi:MAG: WD40/YVTN/BNR-like repeat-containing protein [Myxococcaceae bacterium]
MTSPRALLCVLGTLVSSLAFAHGAAPATSSLVNKAGTEDHLLIGTSFGTLYSEDKGENWRWICEEAMSPEELPDPLLLWTANGNMLAGDFFGLNLSTDNGCTWKQLLLFNSTGVTALQAHPTQTERVYATSGRFDLNTNSRNGVYVSNDNGESFGPLIGADGGAALMREQTYFSNLRVAPGQPSRMYASAWWYNPIQGWLFRSDDSGLTWTEVYRTALNTGPLTLLGVSRVNPDVLFASADEAGTQHILRSENAGAAFTEVLTLPGAIKSLEISADGNTVYLVKIDGLWRSTDAGKTFEKLTAPSQNVCAKIVGDTLYACAEPTGEGWSLARTRDTNAGFTPVLNFQNVRGPHKCPAETPVAKTCTGYWPALKEQLRQFGPTDGVPSDDEISGPEENKGCGCSGSPASLGALALAAVLLRRARHRERK